MLFQIGAQTGHVALVEQIDGMAKDGVFNALMVGQVQLIGARGFRDMKLESGPTGKAVFTGDCEERIAELEAGGEDLGIGRVEGTGMELSEALNDAWIAIGVAFEQVFCLVFEVVKAGIGREAFYRSANFLSYAQVRNLRAEREFIQLSCEGKVDFCPVRGPDAPFYATTRVAWQSLRKPALWVHNPKLSRPVDST